MKGIFGFLIVCVLFASGCGLNDNAPAYIEKIGTHDIDNDGFDNFYYVLCDSSGKTTTSDGSIDFVITAPGIIFFLSSASSDSDYVKDIVDTLRYYSWGVRKEEFYKARIGDRKIWTGGLGPATMERTSADRADITFKFTTPNGQVMTKKEIIIIKDNEFYIKGDHKYGIRGAHGNILFLAKQGKNEATSITIDVLSGPAFGICLTGFDCSAIIYHSCVLGKESSSKVLHALLLFFPFFIYSCLWFFTTGGKIIYHQSANNTSEVLDFPTFFHWAAGITTGGKKIDQKSICLIL